MDAERVLSLLQLIRTGEDVTESAASNRQLLKSQQLFQHFSMFVSMTCFFNRTYDVCELKK